MQKTSANINWDYSGKPDFLLGTGATKAESRLAWSASLIGIGVYAYLYAVHALDWKVWQYSLAILIAADILGGVVANSLNSCKRFYHTPAKSDEPGYTRFLKNHLAFSAIHIYPILISVIYGGEDYLYGIFWYAVLLLSTIIILKTPLYLRRPVAFWIFSLGLVLNFYLIAPIHGFEWLIPALFIKIIYGHLVQEEPYRPETERQPG